MRTTISIIVLSMGVLFSPMSSAVDAKGARSIDAAHTGTYIVEGLPDQGFFLTVDENETGPFLFFSWFTFFDGQPFWLVGVEFFSEGDVSIDVPVGTRRGPGFLDFSGTQVEVDVLGTMRFLAQDCSRFDVEYDLGTTGTGTLVLDRLTGIKDLDCAEAGAE